MSSLDSSIKEIERKMKALEDKVAVEKRELERVAKRVNEFQTKQLQIHTNLSSHTEEIAKLQSALTNALQEKEVEDKKNSTNI